MVVAAVRSPGFESVGQRALHVEVLVNQRSKSFQTQVERRSGYLLGFCCFLCSCLGVALHEGVEPLMHLQTRGCVRCAMVTIAGRENEATGEVLILSGEKAFCLIFDGRF